MFIILPSVDSNIVWLLLTLYIAQCPLITDSHYTLFLYHLFLFLSLHTSPRLESLKLPPFLRLLVFLLLLISGSLLEPGTLLTVRVLQAVVVGGVDAVVVDRVAAARGLGQCVEDGQEGGDEGPGHVLGVLNLGLSLGLGIVLLSLRDLLLLGGDVKDEGLLQRAAVASQVQGQGFELFERND